MTSGRDPYFRFEGASSHHLRGTCLVLMDSEGAHPAPQAPTTARRMRHLPAQALSLGKQVTSPEPLPPRRRRNLSPLTEWRLLMPRRRRLLP
jgi:hypothetical protein